MPRKSPWTIEELMDRTIPDGSCRIWFGPQLKGQPIVRINGLRTPVKRAIFTLQGGREPIPTKTGQIVRYTARCGHALCVATKHFNIGQNVMAERDRLRDLHVGETRHDGVGIFFR